MKTKELSFEEKFKAYKAGKSDAPVIYKDFNFTVNSDKKTVVISREEKDRDGEIVKMDGMILREWIKDNGLPMIDSHNMYESIGNILGAIRNVRIEDISGKKSFVGDPDFAPTDRGNEARIIYMGVDGGKPYATNVSMGFAVYDYDNETKEILEWEPFEASLVTVGANMSARFISKSEDSQKETSEQMAKDLARFKQIHEPFKEFCKLFLSDSFTKRIGMEKTDNLLLDVNTLYDIMNKTIDSLEAPVETQEEVDPQEEQVETKAPDTNINTILVKEIDTIFQNILKS